MTTTLLHPELSWTGLRFERNLEVEITDGIISRVATRTADRSPSASDDTKRVALLPGFSNAHSHTFQRSIRGRTERFPVGRGSFWSWRDAMYRAANDLSADQLHQWNVAAFDEMRSAGITSVGEFHYLHHDQSLDFSLDEVVLDAARVSGIRLTLLHAFYQTAGPGIALADEQRRFSTPDPETFLEHFDDLRESHQSDLIRFGLVAHSVRAVPVPIIQSLWKAAKDRDVPFHMHVEEQRREIEEFFEATGERPMEMILRSLDIDERFTAVHCTHTRPEELAELTSRGGNICITPLTEANLGDGIQPALLPYHRNISLGSDSNSRISMLEEMRWLEYVQRLSSETRGAFTGADDRMAINLFDIATVNGLRSIGWKGGRIEKGSPADLITIDLDHASLLGADDQTLLESLITGSDNEVVLSSCVGGAWRQHRTGNSRR